jgi:para-aminobenzoate synthetase/4-amino-4-deoxychorismate lyase
LKLVAGKMVDDRDAVFALLDDCHATAARRSSRLYTRFLHERVCVDTEQLDAVCDAVAADLRRGLHAVMLGDYEFGRQLVLHGARSAGGQSRQSENKTQRDDATLRFLLFEQ